jgi:hypothetical protein
VRGQCAVDRLVTRGRTGGGVESGRLAAKPQRAASLVQPAGAEERRGRGPERAVAGRLLGTQLRRERDQLGEVGDRVDLTERGDADEPMCVEVVAKQKRGEP